MNKMVEKVMMGILLSIAPLIGGAYDKIYFNVFSIILLIYLLYKTLSRKEIYTFSTKVIFVFLIQLFIAFLGIFKAINIEESIYGFIYILDVLLLFHIFINENLFNATLEKFEDKGKSFLWNIFLSGSIVCFVNVILVRVTFANYQNRLGLIVGYPNTLAIMAFSCFIYGIYLLNTEYGKNKRYTVNILNYINVVAFVLTFSRSMWVFAFAMLLICFIAMKNNYLIRCISIQVGIGVLSAVVISINLTPLVVIFTVGAMILLRKKLFNDKLKKEYPLSRIKIILASILGIGILTLVILKPSTIYQRVISILQNPKEFQERIVYYLDSINIFKDYYLFGTGAGGWGSISFKYQTALYATKFVHSSIVQNALNYGGVGLIFIMFLFVASIFYSIKAYRRAINERSLVFAASSINLIIFLHSITDIDFEFPIVYLIFCLNFVILYQLAGERILTLNVSYSVKILICAIIGAGILFNGVLCISNINYSIGLAEYRKDNYAKAEQALRIASLMNPISSNTYYAIGEANRDKYDATKDNKYKSLAIEGYNLARKFDEFNPRYPAGLSFVYRVAGDYENSITEYENLIQRQPLIIEYYEGIGKTLEEYILALEMQGKVEKANFYNKKIIKIEKDIEKAREKVSPLAVNLKHKVNLKLSSELQEFIRIAKSKV